MCVNITGNSYISLPKAELHLLVCMLIILSVTYFMKKHNSMAIVFLTIDSLLTKVFIGLSLALLAFFYFSPLNREIAATEW
jgi:hypothetical protein